MKPEEAFELIVMAHKLTEGIEQAEDAQDLYNTAIEHAKELDRFAHEKGEWEWNDPHRS